MRPKLALALVIAGVILLNFHWVSNRLYGWDEGFYLHAAHRVYQGEEIYSDFFYPFFPLFPYLLAPLSSPGFQSFFAWRGISAGIGILLGLLIFCYGLKTSAPKGALLAFFFYSVNGSILGWHTVLHPGAFAEFATFVSFVLLIVNMERNRSLFLFLSGLVLSVGVLLRIVYLPLGGLWLYFIWREWGRKAIVQFLVGFALVMVFPLFFLLRNWDAFLFETITFQLIRGRVWTELTGVGQIWLQKGTAVGKFLVLPQTMIVIVLAILGVRFYSRAGRTQYRAELLLVGAGLVIFFGHLALVPVHFYYFVQSLPFLIASQIPYLDRLLKESSRLLIAGLVAVYGVGIVLPYSIYVRGIREQDRGKKISDVTRIVETIESLSSSDDEVLSMNPGYLHLSGREGPGLQPWLLDVASRLDEERKRRYKIADLEDVRGYVESERPRLVVGDFGWHPAGYQKVLLPWVVIYVRDSE